MRAGFPLWLVHLLLLGLTLRLALCVPRGVVRRGPELIAGRGTVLSHDNITFLLEDVDLVDGVLFAFSAFFLSSDPVRFQIWRPQSVIHRNYTLIWEGRVVVQEKGIKVVYIKDMRNTTCLSVLKGDRVGIYAENGPVPISYAFMKVGHPATLRHPLGTSDRFVAIGQSVSFDALTFPYEYSVNAFIDTDRTKYQEPPRVFCPDITLEEPTTPQLPTSPPETTTFPKGGATGHPGPRGPPGEAGRPGFIYPYPHPVANNCKCQDDGSLMHNHIILGIFVWLTALTIINIFYICFACLAAIRKCYTSSSKKGPTVQLQQNDQNIFVEKIRETVREYNTNPTGTNSQALATLNGEVKI